MTLSHNYVVGKYSEDDVNI